MVKNALCRTLVDYALKTSEKNIEAGRDRERERHPERSTKSEEEDSDSQHSQQPTPRSVRPEKPRAATAAMVTWSRFHLARDESARD